MDAEEEAHGILSALFTTMTASAMDDKPKDIRKGSPRALSTVDEYGNSRFSLNDSPIFLSRICEGNLLAWLSYSRACSRTDKTKRDCIASFSQAGFVPSLSMHTYIHACL